MRRFAALAIFIFFALLILGNSTPGNTDWPAAGGGPDGIRYSKLKQIHRGNVRTLRVAWQWNSGDEYEGSEMQCNPIVINGVLYATTPRLRIVALDAATGRLIWDFDARRGEKLTGKRRNRGLVLAGHRLFAGIDEYLYSIDARTGKLIEEFGAGGRVDLRLGLGRDGQSLMVRSNSPGVVFQDLLIVGTLVSEDLPSAPGYLRAYDIRTGKIRWTFHTIPHPGEYGYETWPKDAWKTSGGANSWPGLALDERRGVVFAPTGSAAFDFYGADRAGDNLFANSLVALDAATGKRIWHQQIVRHDVWDRDLPSQPSLVRVRRNGKLVDAVAQITKSGHVWVFDRENGKPLFPVAEVAAEASAIEGERLSPKQVLPLKPEAFARQQLTEAMLTRRTPAAHKAVLDRFRSIRSGPQFTAPSREGTVIFPGYDGGGEWGGAAWDPETGLFYVNSNEMPWILRLVPRKAWAASSGRSLYQSNCASCHRADMQGTPPEFPSLLNLTARLTNEQVRGVVRKGAGRMPGFVHLGDEAVAAIVDYLLTGKDVPLRGRRRTDNGLLYTSDGYNKFLDPDGYPAVEPPWGTLNAINLHTGDYAWKIPFGEFPELAAQGMRNTGSENYGGPVVTAGGLLFIGATNHDRKFRAYDKSNGKLLWETLLPAAGNATPTIYEVGGRQYVVIGAGGGKSEGPSGGSYIAYALE